MFRLWIVCNAVPKRIGGGGQLQDGWAATYDCDCDCVFTIGVIVAVAQPRCEIRLVVASLFISFLTLRREPYVESSGELSFELSLVLLANTRLNPSFTTP